MTATRKAPAPRSFQRPSVDVPLGSEVGHDGSAQHTWEGEPQWEVKDLEHTNTCIQLSHDALSCSALYFANTESS